MGKGSNDQWSLEEVPGAKGTPLLAHVETWLDGSVKGPLPDKAQILPDEPARDPSVVAFSAGSYDASVAPDAPDDQPLIAAAAVIGLLRADLSPEVALNVAALVDAIQGPRDVDRFLEALGRDKGLNGGRAAELGRWFCRRGTGRSMVKVELGLVGRFGEPADRDLVMRLGLLEELTLYSLVALQNLLPDPEPAIFDLAQQVDGWGRVHAIRRLKATTDPEIRRWLLRGGADISILIMEVAYIAATAGGLVDALRGQVDEVLLNQAGLILATLAEDGPAQGMADYDDAAEAITLYLRHLGTARPTLEHIDHVLALRAYVKNAGADRWNDGQGDDLAQAAGEWLYRVDCAAAVQQELASDEFTRVRYAIGLAPHLGLDPRPTIDVWLERRPHDFSLWYFLLQRTSTEELPGVVDRARATLPLAELASGAEPHLGVGPDHGADSSLGAIVGRLSETPGLGWDLIDVALRNRVIRNRNLAVRTLSHWSQHTWPPQARDALAAAIFREPNAGARRRMRELLETGSLSE